MNFSNRTDGPEGGDCDGVNKPGTHAATSNAAQQLRMPILACAMHADEGILRSGVAVATMIKSITFGSSPPKRRRPNRHE